MNVNPGKYQPTWNDIDDLLKPYEDEQPPIALLEPEQQELSHRLTRIPSLVTPTGAIIPEFQEFFNKLVDAITSCDSNKLYEISDKSLNKETFSDVFQRHLGVKLMDFVHTSDDPCRNIDIELNISRFAEKHRAIVGSFFVLLSELTVVDISDISHSNVSFKKYSSEIFFTYKNERFCVISAFESFVVDE